jgi:hypothetical protein
MTRWGHRQGTNPIPAMWSSIWLQVPKVACENQTSCHSSALILSLHFLATAISANANPTGYQSLSPSSPWFLSRSIRCSLIQPTALIPIDSPLTLPASKAFLLPTKPSPRLGCRCPISLFLQFLKYNQLALMNEYRSFA